MFECGWRYCEDICSCVGGIYRWRMCEKLIIIISNIITFFKVNYGGGPRACDALY